ncbi:MAG: sensor histidine kinase, partial [Planctomycetota bacterium]
MSENLQNLSITDRELFYRLGWFTRIRWAMGALALLALLINWYGLRMRLTIGEERATFAPAVNVVMIIFLYNAAFTFLVHVIRARGTISRPLIVQLALGQLLCDMIAVCVLVHYTGGVENFFIVLILLPLVIATALLPRSLAYATAAGAAALVHLLAWGELTWGDKPGIWQHVNVAWRYGALGLYADPLYVLAVTSALTVTIFAIVFVATSISKRLRDREAELEEAYRSLRLADEAKSFFMRKAGHEMRAPLAAIHSILEAIFHTSRGLENKHRRMIARTQKRTAALMTLVDELREYSRLRSVKSILKVKTCRLSQIVRNTVELFNQHARSAGVAINCWAHREVRVKGDEELLREVVTNLIANAIQYTPRGGRIDVNLSAARGQAALVVTDTGIGISPQARDNIFKDFFRSPEARKMVPNGTGLGLVITKRIVDMHGGTIKFSARAAGGTVFT